MFGTFKAAWGRNRRVADNFVALSVVQASNYVVPVIILPYLFRVLGDSRYGLVELARAVSIYFLTLTDYGFSLSATREVAVHREDRQKVSEIFSAVMVSKFLLVVLSLVTLAVLVLSIPRLRADWAIYFLAFGHVVGQWLLPAWLFQGMERMRALAIVNVIARALYIVSIFLFVTGPADYIYVPALQSTASILTGLIGLVMAFRKFPVHFYVPAVGVLKREFKNGWHIFLSRMATNLYTTSNIVILGLFADVSSVGYYAAGDKIARAVQGLQIPLSQAIFPHIGKLVSESRRAALTFASHILRIVSVLTLGLSVALFAAAPYVARAALGSEFAPGVTVIRILSFLPFIIGLSNIFGVQIMVNFGLKRAMTRVLATAGFFNVIMALSLVVPFRHVGVAIAALLTETFVTTVMFVVLRRKGIDVLRPQAGGVGRDA
ncbi:MAG: flippase [Sedimentisphaerales bacterium]|nr:flippase [Sedimentisphaerales bacterium]